MLRKVLIFICFITLLLAGNTCAYAKQKDANLKKQRFKQLRKIVNFKDQFKEPQLGTVPLPPSKEMPYPYPDGQAKLIVNYPDQVQVGENFDISVTYETDATYQSYLMIFHKMYMRGGTNLPTTWRQICDSPVAPEFNDDVSGSIESLPSVEWVDENWGSWYGVGIAPFESGNQLFHTSKCNSYWNHGHYFWAFDGESITFTQSSYSFDSPGTYQFEINPDGFYASAEHPWDYIPTMEPISFDIEAIPSNYLTNFSFEIDDDTNTIPDNWNPYGFEPGDGRSSDFAQEGSYSLKISGNSTKTKSVKQNVPVSGNAGDELTFSGWNKTEGATTAGRCVVALLYLNYTDGSRELGGYLFFGRNTHDWLNRSTTIVANKEYSSIDITIGYFFQTGTTYFDNFKLSN